MLGDSVNISIQFDTFSYSSFHSNINQAIIMGGLLIEAICKRESTNKTLMLYRVVRGKTGHFHDFLAFDQIKIIINQIFTCA